jgi:2-polyprenyl-6-methoxyphenol hydroxylase-like FAD-dependent oxidoreductase
LEDALTLGSALAERGPSTTDALERYAAVRDARLRNAVPWSIFIGRTFDGPHAGWLACRRFGYVASRVPAMRRGTVLE